MRRHAGRGLVRTGPQPHQLVRDARSVARNWLRHIYEADFRLDAAGPTWAASVLRTVRLPRWTYEGHEYGAAILSRVPQKMTEGMTDVRIRILPEKPKAIISMEVDIRGNWSEDDEIRPPPPGMADIHEEAEALLVLLGCRSPKFRWLRTHRVN